MTKQQFLDELNSLLKKLTNAERADILGDYEEHIQIAMKNGKSEYDAVRALGTPKAIAKELMADYYIKRAEVDRTLRNVVRAIFATIGLGFFNLVFAICPVLCTCALLAGFFCTSLGMMVAPILGLLSLLGWYNISLTSFSSPTEFVFAMLVVEGVGILWLCVSILLARFFGKLFLRYLKLNLRLMKGGQAHVA